MSTMSMHQRIPGTMHIIGLLYLKLHDVNIASVRNFCILCIFHCAHSFGYGGDAIGKTSDELIQNVSELYDFPRI